MSAAERLAIRASDQPRLARMEASEYHADPCEVPSLSASIAKVLEHQSPAHAFARHPRLGATRRPDAEFLDDGAAIHTMLLGTGKPIAVIEADDWRTKAAKEAREEARARGSAPVLAKTWDRLDAAATVLRGRFADLGIVLDGQSELAAFWTETADNGAPVQCRGMPDHIRASRAIYDLKSCESADLRTCQRHANAFGYDIQRAAYVSAVEKLYPHLAGRIDFVLVYFELHAPYVVTPVRLNGEFRALGERRWRRAVNAWERCLRTERWPSYVDGIADLAPPDWTLLDDSRKDTDERT